MANESEEQRKQRERKMFGMTIAEIEEIKRHFDTDGLFTAISQLSDAQEQIALGMAEEARQTINRAKYLIDQERTARRN